MAWQKRARVATAAFGIGCAVMVYAAMGERRGAGPAAPIERLDPTAVAESTAGVVERLSGVDQEFKVSYARQMTYAGGRTKMFEVRIQVRNRGGRDFVLTGGEAQAGENQRELHVTGDVVLAANDGLQLKTARAIFNQDTGLMHADGAVSFTRGRMSGSGTDVRYDNTANVIGIARDARIVLADANGAPLMDFAAGTATLDRMEHLLTMEGSVHVLREQQVIDADKAIALLSDNDEFVTFIQLRGGSKVAGGAGALASMSAHDIDLNYTDDGQVLEQVALVGDGSILMAGRNGSAGRELGGGALNLDVAPDGSITHAVGRDGVRLALPATEGASAQTIGARSLTATGAEGAGLTDATFSEAVTYDESARKDIGARSARSDQLMLALSDAAVRSAVFTGRVTFNEGALKAGAARVAYSPARNALELSGEDAGGGPRVADERVSIEGRTIQIALDTRRMTAAGSIRMTLRPGTPAARDATPARANDAGTRMPGLLKQDQAVTMSADAVQYQGASGLVVYTGQARLLQGDTTIRADTITIDQEKGDLLADGAAESRIVLDTGVSHGRADRIRYEDAGRTVTYVSAPVVQGRGTLSPAIPPSLVKTDRRARLSGDRRELRAARIDLYLAATAGRLERFEADGDVEMETGARRVIAGRLTYAAAGERYDASGTAVAPVRFSDGCNETTGRTLTFFTSADRMIVDGNDQMRTVTQTTNTRPCAPAGAAAPPPAGAAGR